MKYWCLILLVQLVSVDVFPMVWKGRRVSDNVENRRSELKQLSNDFYNLLSFVILNAGQNVKLSDLRANPQIVSMYNQLSFFEKYSFDGIIANTIGLTAEKRLRFKFVNDEFWMPSDVNPYRPKDDPETAAAIFLKSEFAKQILRGRCDSKQNCFCPPDCKKEVQKLLRKSVLQKNVKSSAPLKIMPPIPSTISDDAVQ